MVSETKIMKPMSQVGEMPQLPLHLLEKCRVEVCIHF